MDEELTAERWQDAKAILADALEEQSAERRAVLIAERCRGDRVLQAEVESLLDQTTAVFDECAADAANRRDMPALESGRRLGAYAIVREIGRGGMGAVYLAERADGAFDRQVAIKVLKRGLDTDEILARFLAERQILARLDHPGIVRVVDAGTSEDGLPYLVMDYVEGVPIAQYAREHHLSVRERLELFRTVCSAVSYAHQHLIVHRDLKPSNILITPGGQVRLLDFGIAKLVEPDAAPFPITVTMFRIMTPEYASPEQVKGEPVTTVSDVYSLGVILYELLTGERPYHLKSHTAEQINKAICEQEPERPSTAVTRSDRQVERREEVRRQLRGDLDNIVLKALRKEPQRRYTSVEHLSEDIRRHLDGLPVQARKDTVSYRAGKFLQRYKLPVAAATLFLLALLAGVIASSWEAHRARLAEAKAEKRFAQVRQLAHSVLFDYHDEIASLPGATKVRERLVKDALNYLDNLSREAGNDSSLLKELAAAYAKVAAVQGGAVLSNYALVSFSSLGDTKGALENQVKSVAIWERLLQAGHDVRRDLASAYTDLAFYYQTLGDPKKALIYTEKSIPLFQALLAGNSADDTLQLQLVTCYVSMSKALGNPGVANLGDREGALEWKNKAQQLTEKLVAEHPDKRFTRSILPVCTTWVSSWPTNDKESLDEALKAVAIFRALVKADPASAFYRRELAIELGNVASSLLRLGDKSGALENAREAQSLYDDLVTADPNDASMRGSAALNRRKLGSTLSANGDYAGALASFREAQQTFAGLVAKDTNNAEFRRQWAYAYLAMSREQLQAGETQEAIRSASEGIKIERALVADSPANANAQNTLALLESQLGDTEAKLQNWTAAEDAYQKGLTVYDEMRNKGMLPEADAKQADELRRKISECEAAVHGG